MRNGKLPWSNPETAFAYGEDPSVDAFVVRQLATG